MAKPRNSARPGGSRAAMEGVKMSENRTPAVVSPVAIAPSTKINEAAKSYSAYLTARGIDVSPEIAQTFWDNESVWRTSPERVAEREAAKFVKDAAKAKAQADRDAAAAKKLESERETIAAKAKALGLIV